MSKKMKNYQYSQVIPWYHDKSTQNFLLNSFYI